jgi:hypothetical protein
MSGLEVEHVWQMSLEPGLGTKHVRCWDLTWVKVDGPDMSGDRLYNPVTQSDKSDQRT